MKYNEDDRIAQSMGYLDFDDHMECLYQEEQYEKAYREQEEKQYYAEQERLHWEAEEKDYEKHLRSVLGDDICNRLENILPKLSCISYSDNLNVNLEEFKLINLGIEYNVYFKNILEDEYIEFYLPYDSKMIYWYIRKENI